MTRLQRQLQHAVSAACPLRWWCQHMPVALHLLLHKLLKLAHLLARTSAQLQTLPAQQSLTLPLRP